MGGLKETGIAIARIVLGVIVLIEGLIVLDIILYVSHTGSTFSEKVVAAYDGAYYRGYAQTYEVGYQEAYREAYDKGHDKGYEIGLWEGSGASSAARLEIHNPTYQELTAFLAGDKTDSNLYIMGEYVCFDFAAELNNNAEANGIRAAYVRIRFQEWGHAVVAFETADRGLVYIEPQTDKDVGELAIGRPYPWQVSGAEGTTQYDDPIVEIQIIW